MNLFLKETTECKTGVLLPALIAGAGNQTSWRFLEFFTVNIRNANTRAAYGRAAGSFLSWCEERGISELVDIMPVHVAGYIEHLQGERSPQPSNSTWPASVCSSTGW